MQLPYDIADDADVESVYNGLMHLGADICLQTLQKIIDADGHPESVDQSQLTGKDVVLHHAPKIFKETCEIRWNQRQKQIYDFVRGLSPYPGAWTTLVSPDGKETVLKIYQTSKTDRSLDGMAPGELLVEKKNLYVATADGLLQLKELQLSGKKRMMADSFVNGMKSLAECVLKI